METILGLILLFTVLFVFGVVVPAALKLLFKTPGRLWHRLSWASFKEDTARLRRQWRMPETLQEMATLVRTVPNEPHAAFIDGTQLGTLRFELPRNMDPHVAACWLAWCIYDELLDLNVPDSYVGQTVHEKFARVHDMRPHYNLPHVWIESPGDVRRGSWVGSFRVDLTDRMTLDYYFSFQMHGRDVTAIRYCSVINGFRGCLVSLRPFLSWILGSKWSFFAGISWATDFFFCSSRYGHTAQWAHNTLRSMGAGNYKDDGCALLLTQQGVQRIEALVEVIEQAVFRAAKRVLQEQPYYLYATPAAA
jgi:hypothetical protein